MSGEQYRIAFCLCVTMLSSGVGPTYNLMPEHLSANRIIDATDLVVLPGLVNTHHHLYQTLGRDDIGQIAVGKVVDIIAFDLNRLDFAGATHDPMSALLFCSPQHGDLSVINGRIIVEDGELRTIDLNPIIEKHNQISAAMIRADTNSWRIQRRFIKW